MNIEQNVSSSTLSNNKNNHLNNIDLDSFSLTNEDLLS